MTVYFASEAAKVLNNNPDAFPLVACGVVLGALVVLPLYEEYADERIRLANETFNKALKINTQTMATLNKALSPHQPLPEPEPQDHNTTLVAIVALVFIGALARFFLLKKS